MDCCGLSSTGLQDIDANNITSDNITIYSFLNVSGGSTLNKLTVNDVTSLLSSLNVAGLTTLNNKTTLLSSLNVSGSTTLNNTTNINGSLYISGLNVFELLNSHGTDLTNLYNTSVDIDNTLNIQGTTLSTLYNFRSDNANALVTLENDSTIIHGITPNSEIQFNTVSSIIDCLSKVDKDGKLCVYHPINVLLPTRGAGFWVVHDELESLQKQAIIDAAKFLANGLAIEGVGVVALNAAEGVAAISLYLGIGSIIDLLRSVRLLHRGL